MYNANSKTLASVYYTRPLTPSEFTVKCDAGSHTVRDKIHWVFKNIVKDDAICSRISMCNTH